jgi:hypothetical protein
MLARTLCTRCCVAPQLLHLFSKVICEHPHVGTGTLEHCTLQARFNDDMIVQDAWWYCTEKADPKTCTISGVAASWMQARTAGDCLLVRHEDLLEHMKRLRIEVDLYPPAEIAIRNAVKDYLRK